MHFATPTTMEDLLKAENVQVLDDKVVDFDKHYWDPTIELKL